MAPKTACVVGAGTAGIATLKECVRQGFKTVCYELDSDIGGIWCQKDITKPTNTPSVYNNLIMNTTKYNSSFSDLPPQPEDPVYYTAEGMHQYLKRAVQHFGLEEHIRVNTRVIRIRKTPDHETTGQWEVYTSPSGDEIAGSDQAGPRGDDQSLSRCYREVFDFVYICSGYFKIPVYPDVPGIDTFPGSVSHSFVYSSPTPYDRKTVLVVGNSLTAIDVASDIAHLAKQVHIALGEGTWILPRCFGKVPGLDTQFSRSIMHSPAAAMKVNDLMMQAANSRLDHQSAGINPSHSPAFGALAMNDNIQLQILAGKVKTHEGLAKMEYDKAYFRDGTTVSGIDAIVYCTGYSPDVSFLDLKIIGDDGKMELFKMTFPVDEKHNTLAVVGQHGGDGPLVICFENQARLATRVMAGKHKLPSRQLMKKDAEIWNAQTFSRRRSYKSYMINSFALTESLAMDVGCYPAFWKIFFKDPVLAFRVWFGPLFAAHYRLVGPDNQWEQAAKVCHAQYEEGTRSVRHRAVRKIPRPDLDQYNKARAIRLLVVSFFVALVGAVSYKYGIVEFLKDLGSRSGLSGLVR